jgi:two-component system, chemotaxis family, chemotaxis protein CheY
MQHCFVIDDSDIVRKYTRLIFESLGFRVSAAADPLSALDRLKTESPDYMLVDWKMPGANPHEFIARVRKLPLQSRPCILYVVTETDANDIQRAMAAGADGYLLKPFNRELIEIKLKELRVAA